MDRELGTVVLVIICLVAGTVVAQPFFPSNGSHFSALAVLGPQQTISGYPTNVSTNQTFLLYGFIGNYEGVVSSYELFVKLGNTSTIISNSTSANAPVVARYSYVVADGQNVTFPMNLSINRAGNNLRLIFELWSYDPSVSNFTYTGLWNQLWLNVTSI
ncbi:MAG: DUF1616 domain-containing protein [Nitrososphaerales archaeon]